MGLEPKPPGKPGTVEGHSYLGRTPRHAPCRPEFIPGFIPSPDTIGPSSGVDTRVSLLNNYAKVLCGQAVTSSAAPPRRSPRAGLEGTLDDYVANTWGVQTYDFGPSTQGLQLLGRTVQDALVNSVQRLATIGVAVR